MNELNGTNAIEALIYGVHYKDPRVSSEELNDAKRVLTKAYDMQKLDYNGACKLTDIGIPLLHIFRKKAGIANTDIKHIYLTASEMHDEIVKMVSKHGEFHSNYLGDNNPFN